MFTRMVSTLLGDEVLKGDRYRTLWSVIVNRGVKGLDIEDRCAGTAMYSSTKDL